MTNGTDNAENSIKLWFEKDTTTICNLDGIRFEDPESWRTIALISLAHVILSFLMPFLVYFTAIYKKEEGFWKNIWKFPNPMITKYRKFMLEHQEHKLRSLSDEEERKKRILKVKKKQEKHTRFLNVSLINEAAMESSFQLWFQTLYMFPIVLFLLGGESGSSKTENLKNNSMLEGDQELDQYFVENYFYTEYGQRKNKSISVSFSIFSSFISLTYSVVYIR